MYYTSLLNPGNVYRWDTLEHSHISQKVLDQAVERVDFNTTFKWYSNWIRWSLFLRTSRWSWQRGQYNKIQRMPNAGHLMWRKQLWSNQHITCMSRVGTRPYWGVLKSLTNHCAHWRYWKLSGYIEYTEYILCWVNSINKNHWLFSTEPELDKKQEHPVQWLIICVGMVLLATIQPP